MKRKLENEFSWSVSRAQLFASCPRAYYYNYYGSWGGWEVDAPERTRQLYMLKNIKPLAMWAGSIVHDTIKEALEAFARGEGFPQLTQLQELALTKMRQGWTEAVRQEWLRYPKRTNILELYYGNRKNLPREQTDSIKERVLTCMDAFAHSATLAEIMQTPYLQWKPVDTLDTFFVDDTKIWCAIDFAYVGPDSILHIIDWKTGSEHRATLRQQLACYALYAMEKWHHPLEKIAMHGVFLFDGGRRSDYPVAPDLLISVKDQILSSIQAMKGKLTDVETNAAEEDNFPCTPSEFNCRQCPFREACPYFEEV
jgi:hypothetical protein